MSGMDPCPDPGRPVDNRFSICAADAQSKRCEQCDKDDDQAYNNKNNADNKENFQCPKAFPIRLVRTDS